MKISSILSSSKKPFASIEIVPPLSGIGRAELIESVRPFMEFKPPFINVTTHRTEYAFIPRADGGYDRQIVRPRMSSMDVCGIIAENFDTEPVPHVICAGASASGIAVQLSSFRKMGISNILALRGDSTIEEKRFIPHPEGYAHADELVEAAAEYDFCIGVGAYPEKHFEAANIEEDILNLKRKVDAGAGFIITQMFFDNAFFFDFVRRCREAGITAPIIPGLKPLSTARQLEMLPQTFSIDIPQELSSQVRKHLSDKEACYRIGTEWCKAQCRDLLAHGVPAIHFYTMSRQDNVISILESCF